MKGSRGAAILVGVAVAFVVAVDVARAIRPDLLLDPDPSWAIARLALWWGLATGTAAAGGAAAGGFLLWSRGRFALSRPAPLPLSSAALWATAAAALLAGAFFRFVALERVPFGLWVDDVSLVSPALALEGRWSDFADSIRDAPFGAPEPYGSVGVLYLEAQRLVFEIAGTTVFGIRLLAAVASVASLATAFLLARELLPRGGSALATLILAGLRWHLIVSRWGWISVVLIPLVDLAALLVLRARRTGSRSLALAAGITAGVGAHVYLAAWAAGLALLALALWPSEPRAARRARFARAVLFALGFAAACAPLFLFREGRRGGYFARAGDHSVRLEIQRTGSLMPPLAAAADSLAGPWFLPDPMPLTDIPGRSRLGWMLGIPVALACARALVAPRQELSAFLLSHAGAALLTSVTGGQAGTPNGYRFAYLTTVTAVAAAAGVLAVFSAVRAERRRLAAIAGIGALAIHGALGARDAILKWGESRDTFAAFHAEDTLLGRAAARWERYGSVSIDRRLGHHVLALDAVRRHALDPDRDRGGAPARRGRKRSFRIAAPDAPILEDERRVERVRDGWGKEWGVVVGKVEGER